MFPDGLAANKVVMQAIAEAIPIALCLPAHCVAHSLQIVWDAGAGKSLANPLYQFTQVIGNQGPNSKVGKALESLADDADVAVGIELNAEGAAFNDFALKYTVKRPLLIKSFFTDVGGSRHCPRSHQALQEHLEEECRELKSGLSAPWYLPKVTHNCYGSLPGNRCCVDNTVARQRLRGSLVKLRAHTITGLATLAANKWRSVSTCVARVAPGVLIHGSLPQAFGRTLASAPELKRIRQMIDDGDERIAAMDQEGAIQADPLAFAILRGKRIVGAASFFQRSDCSFLMLSHMVAAAPVDKLFSTFFEAEAFAKTLG
jgi:hypothetical protein